MKRFSAIRIGAASVMALAACAAGAGAASAASAPAGKLGLDEPLCASGVSLCADPHGTLNGYYVGHDEPSLEFKSSVPGSGNDMTYLMTLPSDPSAFPTASGASGTPTWNFELRPTFWFGMTLCDGESSPEFTKKCTPDSDANNLVATNPASSDYIGKHPGNAFMELQFYGPGYVPQFEGFGCTAHQYCAAMTIDSRTLDQNDGVENTAACNNYVLGGPEPINWAYITHSGQSQAPANPLFTGLLSSPNVAAVNPNLNEDLLMSPGDVILIHMHDTAAGFQVNLVDLTTHQSGSMTASIANGFGHILYTPHSKTCKEKPYAFHPEYSTADPRGNTWSAHTYNIAMSDEIGHFENCLALSAALNCTQPGSQDAGGLDEDDGNNFCVPGTDSTLVMIDGCFSADEDFDGQSYRPDWPGTDPNVGQDQALHPSPVLFTSPVTGFGRNYSTVAFETDLPAIEVQGAQDNPPFCDPITGANCVNPPAGAQFYPFFSTSRHDGTCTWQDGGNDIPGTIDHFGGNSTAEFGNLLKVVFPMPGFTTQALVQDFNSGDLANPCPTF
jgi:hypothetical protein